MLIGFMVLHIIGTTVWHPPFCEKIAWLHRYLLYKKLAPFTEAGLVTYHQSLYLRISDVFWILVWYCVRGCFLLEIFTDRRSSFSACFSCRVWNSMRIAPHKDLALKKMNRCKVKQLVLLSFVSAAWLTCYSDQSEYHDWFNYCVTQEVEIVNIFTTYPMRLTIVNG